MICALSAVKADFALLRSLYIRVAFFRLDFAVKK